MRSTGFLDVVFSCLVAAQAPCTFGVASDYEPPEGTEVMMTYHVGGGYSPYRYVQVHIKSTGRAEISWQKFPGKAEGEYEVAPHEWRYFLGLFRLARFFTLTPKPPLTNVKDRSTSTLRLKVGEKSREIVYTWDDDADIERILQAFWRVFEKAEVLREARATASRPIKRAETVGYGFSRWEQPLRSQRKEAAEIVNGVLSGGPAGMNLVCIYGEAKAGDSKTVDILLRHLEEVYTPEFRPDTPVSDIIDALGVLGDRRAAPFLLKVLDESEVYAGYALLALARLGCDAVLPEAVRTRNLEALGHIGGGHKEAWDILEEEAFGLGTSRHRRALATRALARIERLRGRADTSPCAHALAFLACGLGVVLLAVPRKLGKSLARLGPVWPRTVGFAAFVLGGLTLFALHVTYFY